MKTKKMDFPKLQAQELARVRKKYPRPIHSEDEAVGMIYKEFNEYAEAVRTHKSAYDTSRELIQIAAIAQAAAEDLYTQFDLGQEGKNEE